MSSLSATQSTGIGKTQQQQYEYETLRLPINKRDDEHLYCNYFVPSPNIFSKIAFRGSEIFTNIQIAKLNGTQFSDLKSSAPLNTGAYTIRCSIQKDIKLSMDDIYYLEMKAHVIPLSNYQIANMLLVFQNSLGMNPAVDLGFSVKPEKPQQPFHEKLEKTFDMTEISSKIEKAVLKSSKNVEDLINIGETVSENSFKYGNILVENTKSLITKLELVEKDLNKLKEVMDKNSSTSKNTIPDFSGIESKLSDIQTLIGTPQKSENTKPLRNEITKLIKERDIYYQKLKEAEDYIDSLDEH